MGATGSLRRIPCEADNALGCRDSANVEDRVRNASVSTFSILTTLVAQETPWGVGPYNPEAPMAVFRVPIECDKLDCRSRLLVHGLLRSDTTASELEALKRSWSLGGLACPEGHPFPHPPFRWFPFLPTPVYSGFGSKETFRK